ncbi:hypothetical protein R2G56_00380 [Nitratireductor aquimarinus]|uniref:Glycine cleavage system H protein n=1 Tax=Nitratireductor aquimarinus TaxID=889300 RepID=A0ABU4AEP8_9HYPH|nr:hypothetical protein [Nitratireductor aquimarinus]MDV6224731.1 hypothetical protein [Nitratireductor aquimarinus]
MTDDLTPRLLDTSSAAKAAALMRAANHPYFFKNPSLFWIKAHTGALSKPPTVTEKESSEMATYFTKTHEWISIENGTATIGVTDHAQKQFGMAMFVDFLENKGTFKKGEIVAVINAGRGAFEVHAPVSGQLLNINSVIDATIGYINSAPMDGGWLWMMTPSDESELSDLMHEQAYKAFIA